MITLPPSKRPRVHRYALLHARDCRAEFALRWQDHHEAPIARPWRWLLELTFILATVAVVAGLYYVAKTTAAKFNPTPTHEAK